MRLDWLFTTQARTGPRSLPVVLLIVLAGTATIALTLTDESIILGALPWARTVGTMLMLVLIPAYMLAMLQFLHDRTLDAVETLAALADADATEAVRRRLQRFPTPCGPLVVAALALFGVVQWRRVIDGVMDGAVLGLIDVFVVLGNALVWALAGVLLAWRIPTALALVRFGRTLEVDLYRLDALRPLARVGTGDVLAVTGSVALSALQSLDAQVQFESYQAGFLVGGLSGAALFLLPLWGVRANVIARKAARIGEIDAQIATTDRDELRELELLTAHRDRIAQLSNWPIDLSIVSRVFAYVIIPPLAWVAAALVEQAIDGL